MSFIRAKIQGIALTSAAALVAFQVINPFPFVDTICDVLILALMMLSQKMR